jgi:hypothetical protein
MPILNTEDTMEWIHINGGNDVNGNPRRAYLRIDNGTVTAVVDEGYAGLGSISRAGYRTPKYTPVRVTVTPGEYRDWVKSRV